MVRKLLAVLIGLCSSLPQAGYCKSQGLFPATDPVGMSPFLDWKTIESEHFRVTFPNELLKIAQRSTDLLEESHKIVNPILKWEPKRKVQVLVLDNTDSENGLTVPFAHVGIVLWVTPPESWFNTAYYDDWLRFLVIHEYTHLVNMDTATGLWSTLKSVFGDTGFPNASWYPWLLEGLAVYMETALTRGGRGRSPYYEMVLRSAVDEGVLDDSRLITLDKMTGFNPYFPVGDTRYLFGYQLMNQAARDAAESRAIDGPSALGEYSKTSGGGIPFFINTYLKESLGQDWYQTWDRFVASTRARMDGDLARIRSQPVSKIEWVTEHEHEVSNIIYGVAVSPDGKKIAYSGGSADRRSGLNLITEGGAPERLFDKPQGVGVAFTPDSQAIVTSSLRQTGQFLTYSDLMIFDLESRSSYQITEAARLRDPDVSPDGKALVATMGKPGKTGLVVLPFSKVDGKYQVGVPEELYFPSGDFDHVGVPKYSKDGSRIYFSLHKNGQNQEDLMVYDLKLRSVSVLVADGYYNRYPAVSPSGEVYFVSNETGVDNLFKYRPEGAPVLASNIVSALSLPAFGPSPDFVYASVFSSAGWDVAKVTLSSVGHEEISVNSVRVSKPLAPEAGSAVGSASPPQESAWEAQDYSVFPSIWPRVWAPTLGFGSSGVVAGAQLLGVDAVDRHRYYLSGTYDSGLENFDASGAYSNRSLGAELELEGDYTLGVSSLNNRAVYSREISLSTTLSYPLLWTYSSLTPSLALNLVRQYYYGSSAQSLQVDPALVSDVVPSTDATLTFSNLEFSSLGVAAEGGLVAAAGARVFLGNPSVKLFAVNEHFFRLSKHMILNPSIKGLWSSSYGQGFLGANTALRGRSTRQLLADFPSDGFNQLTVRGYPGVALTSRGMTVGSLNLVFPIARIFRGIGTLPVYLQNFYGFAFAESAYGDLSGDRFLSSSGGGLRLTGELFLLAMNLSVEYHHGFQTTSGGQDDVFFRFLLTGISF